ncbi:hypothetical protein J6590_097550, partial [Homalodisca vitripennis]
YSMRMVHRKYVNFSQLRLIMHSRYKPSENGGRGWPFSSSGPWKRKVSSSYPDKPEPLQALILKFDSPRPLLALL